MCENLKGKAKKKRVLIDIGDLIFLLSMYCFSKCNFLNEMDCFLCAKEGALSVMFAFLADFFSLNISLFFPE